MKLSAFLVAATAGTSLAYPGMANLMKELLNRQAAPPNATAVEMIGDLVQGASTPVGNQVKNCLLGTGPCQNVAPKTYRAPFLWGFSCFFDTCCVWDYVQADLVKMFKNPDGTCNDLARASVRLGFHDAGAWSKASGSGGADGSLILSSDEYLRPENNGLQNVRTQAKILLSRYAIWGIGAADLAQFMHNVATVVCPLGPRINTYVGRQNSYSSNPPGLLPDTRASADSLIGLFIAKTIGPKDLIALIGAHTTAKQRFVDPSRAGQSLDSTPGIWDVKFYSETLQPTSPPGVFRLPSDQTLASDPRTNTGFGVFANPSNGQQVWNALYSTAYVRLQLLGVNRINKLTDCTKVLPNQITKFP